MSGYRALRESAAWVDISSRGRIRVSGDDRAQFVHAMCSNDVESLRPGQGVRGFFLDVQGHIQADTRIFVSEDHVLIDCEPARPEQLREHLERFIVMDDVTLQRHSGAAVALEGPSSDKIAREVLSVTPPPAQPYSHVHQGGLSTIRASLTGQPGLWLLVEEGSKIDLAAKLGAAGVPTATANDVLTVRVENGVPRQGEDFSGSTLPNHVQQPDALSFTKGCYLGQEIVERVRSRGQINRLLVGVELETTEPPAPGAVVLVEEKEAGRLTSPVFSPTMERVVAFAILRREAASPGTEFTVNGRRGRVRPADGDMERPKSSVLVASE